jgi:hypothetical protein
MNRPPNGRKAALPAPGYRPMPRKQGCEGLVVRFVPENPREQPVDFDFAGWPVSRQLQKAFADAFSSRTRGGSRVRAEETATSLHRVFRAFATYLGRLESPPTRPSQLTQAQLQGWYLSRAPSARRLGELKSVLRHVEGLDADFRDAVNEAGPLRNQARVLRSYSPEENRRILQAARADVRAAAVRIRAGRTLLADWRRGDLLHHSEQTQQRGELLDYLDRHDDVPRSSTGRNPKDWVYALGTVADHFAHLHLTSFDVGAFAVLLVGLTGQNPTTIAKATAEYHRPDGYAGGPPSAVIKLDKPRRGSARHMDVALTSVAPWAIKGMPAEDSVSRSADNLDLHTPFGVYTLLVELAAPARIRLDTDDLFVWWAPTGGGGVGRGFRTRFGSDHVPRAWLTHHRDLDVAGGVTLTRLRLTFNELQQRPAAHTEVTLANEYLVRNRGNLAEYQAVVATALAEQVKKAETRAKMQTLSAADVAEARTNPTAVAARYGMDTPTLERLLAGELNTVLGACVDEAEGDQVCTASFMLCLGCPCARATPAHLPLQVAVYDALLTRKAAITPLRWATRFAESHYRLADLLDQAGDTAVADARAAVTDSDAELVRHFLERDLDIA